MKMARRPFGLRAVFIGVSRTTHYRICGRINGMSIQAIQRKVKRSFTLSPESVAFVSETRERRRASSDSEALELLLRETKLKRQEEELSAAITEYYDTASDDELREASEWAEVAGPSVLLSSDPSGEEK
jgi:hypothetical protein